MERYTIPPVPALLETKLGVSLMGDDSGVKLYRLSEVAEKNGRRGAQLWIVVKDSVYDMTPYLNEHPGGDAMLDEAGRDATKVLEDLHSSDAWSLLPKYKIGEIVEEERKYDANGKKKKKVLSAPPDDKEGGGFLSACCCGLI